MRHDPDLDAIIARQPVPFGKNGRWKIDPYWAVPLAISVIGWIVTILLAYGAFNARLLVVESAQQMLKEQQHERDLRLQRLEDKLDLLLRRP